MRYSALLLAFVIILTGCAQHAPQQVHIGLELPLAGDAGADGILARNAIESSLRDSNRLTHDSLVVGPVARDSAHGGSANAHQDEGTDASGLPPQAAAAILDLARDPSILVAIGGLRPDIAAADAVAAHEAKLPLVTIAPVPDGCRAAGVPIGAPPAGRAVSARGGVSLESLAVARLVLASGYQRLVIRSDDAPSRANPAMCLSRLLHGRGASVSITAPQTDETNAAALVYFAPTGLGVLVCDPSGAAALNPSVFTAMGHGGYDSRKVPRGCGWLRQRMLGRGDRPYQRTADDDILAAQSAASIALWAIRTTARSSRYNNAKVTRDVIWAALTDPDIGLGLDPNRWPDSRVTLKCSGGSAWGAWFELQPRRRGWRAPVFIHDQRCNKAWVRSSHRAAWMFATTAPAITAPATLAPATPAPTAPATSAPTAAATAARKPLHF